MTDQLSAAAAAELRAAAARRQLAATIATAQARLAPVALAQEVVQTLHGKQRDIVRDAIGTARRYPLPLAGTLTALGLFLFRRPLIRLFSRHKRDATPASSTSLTLDSSTQERPRAARRKSS